MAAQAQDVLTGTDVVVWLEGEEIGVWGFFGSKHNNEL